MACVWLSVSLIVIVFLEFATPQFLIEYDSRPNRLFVEYLVYPQEVSAMLWNGYRCLLLLTVLASPALSWLVARHFRSYAGNVDAWRARTVLLVWPIVVLLLFVMIRSSFQHRPANLASFAFCDDAMVNSLVTNSAYSVLSAVYGLKNESQSSEMYGDMPVAGNDRSACAAAWACRSADFTSDELPTLHRQIASVRRERAAQPGHRAGGKPGRRLRRARSAACRSRRTSSGLADRGHLVRAALRHRHALGARHRGGRRRLSADAGAERRQAVKSQKDFATLASVLRRAGYRNEFVYGGESHFDNMRGFFLGNGFHDVVDRDDFTAPKFVGSWGVSGRGSVRQGARAHQRAASAPASRSSCWCSPRPTTRRSNSPTDASSSSTQRSRPSTTQSSMPITRSANSSTVRAQQRYWEDTVFLVVADHDTRVYGDELVPVDKFHIPGVILGADIAAATHRVDRSARSIWRRRCCRCWAWIANIPFPAATSRARWPEFGNAPPLLAPRAMMQFDQTFAWLEDDHVTVLLPDGSSRHFSYDRLTRKLEAAATSDPEMTRQALAHVLMPNWLYNQRRYGTSN